MGNNLDTLIANTNKDKFSYRGQGQDTIKSVNDISQATVVKSVTGETVSLSAGAAGTTGVVRLEYAPIMDSTGARIGYIDDTSISLTGGTTLDGSEIQFNPYNTDTNVFAALSNGDYAIDYVTGLLFYKKADAGVSVTIDYKYTTQEIDLSVSTVEIGDVGINKIQDVAIVADNAAAPATDYPLPIGGQYNATDPSYADGDRVIAQFNDKGQLKVTGGA